MKKISPLIISIFVLSCSGNHTIEQPNEENFSSEENGPEEIIILETSEDTIEYSSEIKKNMQIDEYVEFLLGDKVSKEPPSGNVTGMGYFYSDLDVKGGYAEVSGAFEGGMTYVLWRMENGADLIGRTNYECGPVCGYDYEFWIFENENQREAKAEVLPLKEMESHFKSVEKAMIQKYPDLEDPEGQYMLTLPKKGTSIIVNMSINLNDFEFPIMELSWDKTKFSVSKKYDDLP